MNPILEMIRQDLKKALGCTEPIAISLAAAKAADYSRGTMGKMLLTLSGNIVKNVMGVGIPGTPFIGAKHAALLGFYFGNSELQLEVLSEVKEDDLPLVESYYKEDKLEIELYDGEQKLYIQVDVWAENHVQVVIEEEHSHFTVLRVDGEDLLQRSEGSSCLQQQLSFNARDIMMEASRIPLQDLEFLMEGVEINRRLSDMGAHQEWGLCLGKGLLEEIEKGLLQKDLLNHMTGGVCSAIDARMDGAKGEAMTNSGSGNQGIITHLGAYYAADFLKSDHEHLLRALFLSNALPIYMKHRLGKLSALCGVITACAGVSAALTYLQGGSVDQMETAVKNILGGISGMICDGAKPGCSMKVATGLANAVHSSRLALKNHGIQSYEGMVDKSLEDTIRHYVRLGLEGMVQADRVILETMIQKA